MARTGRPAATLDEWLDWKQRLECQKASGLSVDVYCLQEGVTRSSFYRWYQRLKSGVPASLIEDEADRQQAESEEVDAKVCLAANQADQPGLQALWRQQAAARGEDVMVHSAGQLTQSKRLIAIHARRSPPL